MAGGAEVADSMKDGGPGNSRLPHLCERCRALCLVAKLLVTQAPLSTHTLS